MLFVAMSSTFDGSTSVVKATVDTTVFPYGDSGSFEFKTKQTNGNLLYIQMNGPLTTDILQFYVVNSNLVLSLAYDAGKIIMKL